MLFTDVRAFTTLSEHCPPGDLVDILNEYFSLVVDAVHQNQGVLDRFVGDRPGSG